MDVVTLICRRSSLTAADAAAAGSDLSCRPEMVYATGATEFTHRFEPSK
jgi:hypothetical protein